MANSKRKSTAPANETKAEKFIRVGNARLVRVRKSLRALGKLDTSAYERKPEQIDAIEKILASELSDTISRLWPSAGKTKKPEIEGVL